MTASVVYNPRPRKWRGVGLPSARHRLKKLLRSIEHLQSQRDAAEKRRVRAFKSLWRVLPNGFMSELSNRRETYESHAYLVKHLDGVLERQRDSRDFIRQKWFGWTLTPLGWRAPEKVSQN